MQPFQRRQPAPGCRPLRPSLRPIPGRNPEYGWRPGFVSTCNAVPTAPANIDDVNVDLAVRTVDQRAVLGRNSNDTFRVEVFNLGIVSMPASNVSLEFRFD